jgi:type IV secretory pathway TraG/TraD family ATPase VirD4
LVLTVKPDEKNTWVEYCTQTNRLDDLIILERSGEYHFDFLDYEYNRSGDGSGITDNIVNVLKTVIHAGKSDQGQMANEGFWEDALDMLLFNVVDLCVLAHGKLKIDDLYIAVQNLPKSKSDVVQPTSDADDPFAQLLYQAKLNVARQAEQRKRIFQKNNPDKSFDVKSDKGLASFKKVMHYFMSDFPGLSDKTRSVVEHSFFGLLFRLIREPIKSLICSPTPNFSPDDCFNGKIILLNLPIKQFDKVGRDAQILFKYVWQRAMERRTTDNNKMPVFLWADEAQNFLHEHDIDYQATARSSKVCTVYLTQNLPNYFAHLGGRSGEFQVKSFLGTMGTKIFHANADMETNKYASDLIGQQEVWKENKGSQFVGGFTMSEGTSQDRDFVIHPEDFTAMRTGGPINKYLVDARIHRQGMPWFSTTRNDRKISFKQSINNNK